MKINVNKFTKTQLALLGDLHCRHGHTFLEHPQCIEIEKPPIDPANRRLGFFDIESSHLKANFGYLLSYNIWDDDNKKMYGRQLSASEIRKFVFDRELLKEFIDDCKHFTHLVVYWGKDRRHDMPFTRTRALKFGLPFPQYGQMGIIDLYDMAKNKLSLHSYRLGVVCEELGIPAKGHPLIGDTWAKACAGHQPSLDYIGTHNKEDVVCMPPVLYTLEPFYRNLKLSV